MAENETKDENVQPPPPTLRQKLALIHKAIEKVDERGKNTSQKYNYAKAEDVYRVVRDEMKKQGVLLAPSLRTIEVRTNKADSWPITRALMTMRWLDADSDEELEYAWAGEGSDPGDKGLNKAYTAAEKYFLIAFFQIPHGDDPEADERKRRGTSVQKSNGPAPKRLPADAAARLFKTIQEAGLEDHLPAKLRSFPDVKELTDLTVDDAMTVHAWATEAKS